MHPLAAVAVKSVGAGTVAALLSVGVVSAASPSPSPSSGSTSAPQASTDLHARRPVVRAFIDSEAHVLGITPDALVKGLRAGKKVSDLAKAKGMTKAQFTLRLLANLTPRLEVLVHNHTITQLRADRIIGRIASGHVPFWDGLHRR